MDIQAEVAKMYQQYNEDSRSTTFNSILYGGIGSGKTRSLKTCRGPILVHSFDPGGLKTLMDEIATGRVIPNSTFEDEDAKNPSAYRRWEAEFDRLRKMDFFSHIGTFAIDSVTNWADALMNEILKRGGRTGGVPQLQDYLVQMNTIRDAIKLFTSLPCDCVLTGHLDIDKDEVSGKIIGGVMVTGKLKQKLPLLFDEIYMATTKETGKGIEYSFLTRSTGIYYARTRLGREGKFDTYETPDFKHLLRKAGLPAEDKPLLKGEVPATN